MSESRLQGRTDSTHPCELDAGNPCRHDDYLCNGYFDTMPYTLSNKFTPCSCGLPESSRLPNKQEPPRTPVVSRSLLRSIKRVFDAISALIEFLNARWVAGAFLPWPQGVQRWGACDPAPPASIGARL